MGEIKYGQKNDFNTSKSWRQSYSTGHERFKSHGLGPWSKRKHRMGMGLARRLQEMGLIPGSVIEVIRNMPTGPVEISVMGTHLAIGRNIASRIYVEKI